MPRSFRSASRVAGLGAASAGLLVAIGITSTAGAGGVSSVAGKASAAAMRFTYTVPDFLVAEELMDGGGPVAQARVDSSGVATSLASLPYPGETGVVGPALLGVVLQRQVPFSYPLYTHADHPSQPKEELSDPSGLYRLKSTAEAGQASGSAAFAAPANSPLFGGSTSTAGGTLGEDGSMTMTADTQSTLLSFGNGMLRIASVESISTTTLKAGETKPSTTNKLVIEGARVGDQAVTIGPDGVHPAAAGTVPIPIADGSKALNGALAAAGLSVRTVATDGDEGDALEIASTHPLPFPGSPKGTAVYRFGGARTSIAVGGGDEAAAIGPASTGPPRSPAWQNDARQAVIPEVRSADA